MEPILRFCYNRVSDRYDAEDLASEILCSVLEGLEKYSIESRCLDMESCSKQICTVL
ncbi:MAG: hypothetical protein J5938_03090 [Clostridia bacterium]|nr:hypothetical protein [Clostridia bacterium]